MELVQVKELNSQFKVVANFYQLEWNDQQILCRSEAVIYDRTYPISNINAVFVMLNPGSCSPQEVIGFNRFVSARADPTQYQLMRLMRLMNWKAIRIINLSDICCGNRATFFSLNKQFADANIFVHSIFFDSRGHELHELTTGLPIIFAWGQDNKILSLAKVAEDSLNGTGLASQRPHLYRHPYPHLKAQCIQWLEDMEQLLQQIYV